MSSKENVKAILLAAGVGRRLGQAEAKPKILLRFAGKSLLQRHLEALAENGVHDVFITVGFEADAIRTELLVLQSNASVVENASYRQGSLVSLFAQEKALNSGATILLMDGDVLCDRRMLARLLGAEGENILLVDRNIEPGDEPVKICFCDETIVDFRKKPEHSHDWHGESVGFFRFSPDMSGKLAERCAAYIAEGRTDIEYEEAIRDLILTNPDRFVVADISDLPWTEIDFQDDVTRAERIILPQLTT